ncbi:MAG: folate-binding protein [Cyanobacteria bacterium P01_D01_bin.105]
MTSLFNRTAWGRIRLTGADRVRFLHNQTTNNIEQLSTGQSCHTVFVTSTGRTIDLATVYAFADALLVVVSPGMTQQLYDWMDRYIFFSDKVTLTNESTQTFMFTLIGDDAPHILKQLSDLDINNPPFTHQTLSLPQLTAPITIAAGGAELGLAGYTILGSQPDAATLEKQLVAAGATVNSQADWEALRLQQGRPAPGAELTDEDNPLEAGLWDSVSFEKGCYIGQETIARLNTYKGVKKRLWGLQLQASLPAEVKLTDITITADGNKVGRVTSLNASHDFALGYVRTKAGGEGLNVLIEGAHGAVSAKTVAVPFIHHEYYTA